MDLDVSRVAGWMESLAKGASPSRLTEEAKASLARLAKRTPNAK